MRDLDNREIITGDFLLVSSGLVSTIDVLPALRLHRERREKDKDAIMTMVLQGSQAHQKPPGTRPIFIIDPIKDQCVQYEETKAGNATSLDPQHLSNSQLMVREDLEDAHIDICTPDLLSLWSDNFDYSTLRSSFLRRVLKDIGEISHNKKIHTYIAHDGYARLVQNLSSYRAVAQDVIARKTYPLCPDANLLTDATFSFHQSGSYLETTVKLAQTTRLDGKNAIGHGTKIGEGALIHNSMIGRRCQIGANAKLNNAYVWDDVRIGENCDIGNSVLADSVTVGNHSTIESGAIISFGVHVAENMTISSTSKLTRVASSKRNSVDYLSKATTSDAQEYDAGSDDEQGGISVGLGYEQPSAADSTSSFSVFSDEEDPDLEVTSGPSRSMSMTSLDSNELPTTRRAFVEELSAAILDMMKNDYTVEDLGLELNRDRMQANANSSEVRRALGVALMDRISLLVGENGDRSTGGVVKEVCDKYSTALKPWLSEASDKITAERAEQVDFLNWLQKASLGKPKGDTLLLFSVKELYELDIVDENGTLEWWEKDEEVRLSSPAVEPFITFLKEAEEEDSEEEDESDDEDQ